MLTMLLSGLWHGADWSFVIWGGLHGVYQVIEDFCHKHLSKKENRDKKEISNAVYRGISDTGY